MIAFISLFQDGMQRYSFLMIAFSSFEEHKEPSMFWHLNFLRCSGKKRKIFSSKKDKLCISALQLGVTFFSPQFKS